MPSRNNIMMRFRNIKTKATQYKMRFVIVCAALAALTGLLFAYNFVFNPASSIHFTLYGPREKSIFSSHLVIPGYNKNSFTVFGTKQAVVGYAIVGDGTKITQERSTAGVSCEGIKDCITKQTKKGQQYSYGLATDFNSDFGPDQVAVLKRGDTKITIIRFHDRKFNPDQWSAFIDTLAPVPVQWLGGGAIYRIYSEHAWSPV